MSLLFPQRSNLHQSFLSPHADSLKNSTPSQAQSILFIDAQIKDAQILASQVAPGTEVVILKGDQDGVTQITEVLADRQNIENIHIFAHGAEGLLQLGSTQLTAENIHEYAEQLAAWGITLTAEGDIFVYGCNVAAGIRGQQFIEQLSQYTQADIAASTDISGSTAVGGDWDFEKTTGAIAFSSPFQPEILENYHSALSVTVPNLLYGVIDTNPSVLRIIDVATGNTAAVANGVSGTLEVRTFTLARSPVNGFIYYTRTSGTDASRLYYWNPATGANVTVTTAPTASPTVGDLLKLTFSNNGTLYLSDRSTNLYVYDTTTGLFNRTITVTNAPGNAVDFIGGSGDIAFDPNDPNALYMTSFQPAVGGTSLLYRINIPIGSSDTVAIATYIGDTLINTGGALGFGPNNGLYASRGGGNSLFSLSTINANPTTVNSGTQSFADFASLPSPIILLDGSKVDGFSTAAAGSSVVYTISVRNTGLPLINAPLEGVRVIDTVPANLIINSWNAVATGGATGFTASGTSAINDTNLTLPPGSSVVYTVNATINPDATVGSVVSNTATISVPAFPATITASDTTTVTAGSADLSITKTDGITSIAPNNNLIYTLVARNNGPSLVRDATITDTFPAQLTSINWSATGSTGTSGFDTTGTGNINDTGISLAPNASITYVVTATVAAGTPDNTTIVNRASIVSSVNDPTPGNNQGVEDNTVVNPTSADLSITKTDGITNIAPGSNTIYTLVATNNGPNAVNNATISDTIPAPLTVVGWSASGSAGTSGFAAPVGTTNILNNTGVSIPSGGSITYLVTATVPNSAANNSTFSNSATIASSANDPTPGNNTSTDTNTVVVPTADLAITKTDGITSVTPGSNVIYTLVATNSGPNAVNNATISDTIPAPLTVVGWSASGSAGTSGFAAPVGTTNILNNTGVSIPSGGSITYLVTATVPNSAANNSTFSNSATIASSANDPTPGNNTSTDTNTVIVPTADLAITKTDGITSISPGGSLAYTIVARNDGPSAVNNATITDTFPAQLTNINWTATGSTGTSGFATNGAGNINATGVSLPSGGSITYVVSAVVANNTPSDTTLVNTVSIVSSVNDPDLTDNQATDNNTVVNPTTAADLTITKTDGVNVITPGSNIVYTLIATNNGPNAVNNATISDTIPAPLTVVGWSVTGSAGTSGFEAPVGTTNVLNDTGVSIPNGGSITYIVTTTVPNSAANNTTFSNTAAIASPTNDPTLSNNTSTDNTTVTVGNQPPVAIGDTTLTPINTAVNISVLTNDSDPDGGTISISGFPSTVPNGTITQVGGQLVFTPANNFTGNVTFPYTISDGQGGSATAVVTVTIGNQTPNQPPVATGDISTTPAGTPDTINVLPNDSDPDGDPITITSVGTPTNGTTRIDDGGTPNDPTDDRVIYTPNPGFVGTDTFPYTISDGRGGTSTAFVTVTVTNTPPIAVGDLSSTPLNTPVSIPVLNNDSDPNNDPLTITGASNPPNGTVRIENGQITYTPNPGFVGTDIFPYTISDGRGGTATAFVTVTVTNTPPVAVGDNSSTSVNNPVSIPVLNNDRDPDGDPLNITGAGTPSNGTVRIDDGGTPNDPTDDRIVYTPNPGFIGTDTFPYTISDGRGGTSTAFVTVTISNNPPVAVGDINSTPLNTPVNVPVLNNDRDPDNDPLNITGVGTPSNGTVTIDDGGTPNDPSDDQIRYTPNPGFVGTDVFPYTISDGRGGTSTAFVTITVLNTVPNPNAQGDQANTPRNTPTTIPVLRNDTDPDGDPLRITTFTANTPNGGTVRIIDNGTPNDPTDDRLVYQPNPTFTGTDTFTYTITDGTGNFSTASVTVTVSNTPPVAVGDIAVTPIGQPVTIGVLVNDRDPDGDRLNISNFPPTTPRGGNITRNDNGTPSDPSDDRLVYQPDPTFTGTDTFTYTITDGQGGTATAAVTVTVRATPPVAVGDIEQTPINSPRTINLLANDRNPNQNERLLLTAFSPTSLNGGNLTRNDNGTPNDPSDDTVTYTPPPGFSGTDTFSYTVSDGRGGTATATVTVNVAPQSVVAVNDVFNVNPQGFTFVDPLGNDKFPPGQRPTFAGFTPSSVRGGTITLDDGGTPNDPSDDRLRYTPAPGFAGTDRFVYTIRDAQGNLSAATVTVNVPGPNSPPVAPNETVNAAGPNPLTFPVLERSDDPNGDPLRIAGFDTRSVRGGQIALNDNGTPNDPTDDRLIYTPPANFTGTDTFLYTVSDGRGGFTTATITINVVNGNIPETAPPLPPPPPPAVNPPATPGTPNPPIVSPQPPAPTPGTFICDSQSAPSVSRENFTDVRLTFAGSVNSDVIFGSSAVNDLVLGNLGNDFIYGYQAEDTLLGGKGADTLVGGKYRDSLRGHRGDDSVVGNQDADTMYGDRGHDILFGGKQDDWLYGGKGNDTVSGDRNNDIVYGHAGDDSLLGNQDSDTLYGDRGNDILHGGKDNDLIYAGKGEDTAFGGTNEDVIYGHIGDDSLMGDRCPDTLYGDTGNDTLYGGKQGDVLHGGKQNDFLSGNRGRDTLLGEIGFDLLHGGKAEDWLYGGTENDTLYGDRSVDVVHGGKGNDLLNGNQDNDTLLGDLGNDVIYGGKGNDWLYGGLGDDTLLGDQGTDVYFGGPGRDLFILSAQSTVTDLALADIVVDFTPGQDAIALAGGLTTTNLNLDFVGGNTIIRLANTNQILGIVSGVTPEQLQIVSLVAT